MRVVHLSTYDVDGGAARAAFRVHESLLAADQQSSMLVRTRHSNAESVHQIARPVDSKALFADLVQKHYIDQNRTAVSTTCFSLGWPAEDLSAHPLVQSADIIHLHWITGLVIPPSLESLHRLKKPIVWTLHDQRAYTGGCHYAAGCRGFEISCQACPQLASDPCGLPAANLADQVRSVAQGGITVVAPSRWMEQCARRSSVFANSRIEVIPYGIDVNRFRALPQEEARARLVLPPDNLLLLFGVDNALEKRKGLRELFDVLKAFGNHESFRRVAAHRNPSLLCFGEMDSPPELPIPIRSFGRVRSDDLLSALYSAADLFLLPSLEDNLPNTVLESLCCGTPVGAFDAGGVPDMVVEGQTGFLASVGDLKALSQIILDSAHNLQGLRSMRAGCRRHVETHFTYERHARAYISLYEDLLKDVEQPRNSPSMPSSNPGLSNIGPNFETIIAPLFKYVFDLDPEVPLSRAGASSLEEQVCLQTRFTRRVKKIVKRAVNQRWPYSRLYTALETEISILRGGGSWPKQASQVMRRLFRLS